ncbi:GNAT family N-acetyltransferase [Leptolyngbya sp. CCNP1308]|uniref:GNAT family N-acetyltransferase n=1 Tax=Leptolyngbya sp. CCNP1308 TaxID=3110255 RepID=UPI002B1EEFE4|nr:GNAT family N-acetyltransferase [Leptolyngbya sp. CCNP1308]MEA5450476.1 GNAT family N-acetyltransferase [Leptolyngbya sp. CCNP1308]
MEIREDDLTGPQIIALLREHLENMHEITPPGSVHALDLERLRAPNITFWTAWHGDDLLGCGALKQLDLTSGEVKSMRTPAVHRRQGIASGILEHIIDIARQRGYSHLYLETGAFPAFAPARALYERYGFEYRGPFSDYTNDPNSSFMEKTLLS